MTKKCRCKSDQTNANVISQVFLVLSATHLSCYVNHKLFMLRNVSQLKKKSKKKEVILTCKFFFLGNMSSLFPVLSSSFFLFIVLPFSFFLLTFFLSFSFFFLSPLLFLLLAIYNLYHFLLPSSFYVLQWDLAIHLYRRTIAMCHVLILMPILWHKKKNFKYFLQVHRHWGNRQTSPQNGYLLMTLFKHRLARTLSQ